jgi:endonuclease III
LLSLQKRKKQVAKLETLAVEKHGEMLHHKRRPPLNQLILGMLGHLTSVRRATRALRKLKHVFVDWNETRVSLPCEVAEAIASTDWAADAGQSIVWLLGEVHERHSRPDMDFLLELTPTQARSCLLALPNVDRALADEVMLMSIDYPVMPLPSSSARMCYRLGLLESERPTIKNQKALTKQLGEQHLAPIHLLLCDLGRWTCLPDEPHCKSCPMRRTCPSKT